MKWNSVKIASELPDIDADVEFVTQDGQLREVIIHHESGCFKITRAASYSDTIQVMMPSLGDKAKRHRVTAATKSGRKIDGVHYFDSKYEADDLVRSLENDGLVATRGEVDVLIDDNGRVVAECSTDEIPF